MRIWHTLQFALTFVPIFFLGAALGASGSEVAGWLVMGLSIAIALAGYEVPRVRRRRQFRSSLNAAGEITLVINESGIAGSFPNHKAQYEWQAFTRYRETELSILLFTSPESVGLWIPKRAASSQQIEELRRLLKKRLPVPSPQISTSFD